MKDLKQLIIKIILTGIVLAIAFAYLGKKPQESNSINFEISKPSSDTKSAPSKLNWYDPFKGVNNMPSK